VLKNRDEKNRDDYSNADKTGSSSRSSPAATSVLDKSIPLMQSPVSSSPMCYYSGLLASLITTLSNNAIIRKSILDYRWLEAQLIGNQFPDSGDQRDEFSSNNYSRAHTTALVHDRPKHTTGYKKL
jgi:hypothetical protein